MNEISFAAALLMGLAGSGHCVAMCGGIAGTFQLASRDLPPLGATLAYNVGRLSSYALAGALVGGFSAAFASQNNHISLGLSLLSAVFMILVGLYVMRLFNPLGGIEKLGNWAIWRHIVKLNRHLMPVNSYPKALLYGALWGWLPCGLVYSALTWAIFSQSAADGALFMALFALGTLPALLALGLGANAIKGILNQTWVRLVLGNLLLWYGLYSLVIASASLVT
ncbi:sulfite exporter TauE/SafE family protein [Pseudoalteromonas sp. T1lg22]|uniref:sulfite exporter TauE/SafE family protein n=1 Tax=Pseudoalteromonas sp. T1lg22 TaxID=2077096 RepID=UPI000CF6701A|nr:sulfite exporter TauE/SafE family protein [Pseudoalteromonas sp. T1lg22]